MFRDDLKAAMARAEVLEGKLAQAEKRQRASERGEAAAEAELAELRAELKEANRQLAKLRPSEPSAQPKSNLKLMLIIAGVVLLFAVGGTLALLMVRSEPPERPRVTPPAAPVVAEPGDKTTPAKSVEVGGQLDKEIIRRIIRRHIGEVKYCYEKGLVDNPKLAGRVVVRFTIGATGRVVSSTVESSTLGNPTVSACVAGAAQRWVFPKPRGANVVVSYPFVLRPTGTN